MGQDHEKAADGQWGQKLVSHVCEEDGWRGILPGARPPSHCPVTAVLGTTAIGEHSDLMGDHIVFWTVVSSPSPLRGEGEEGGSGVGLSPG